ncbi:MAG: hypothetical protein ACT4PG_09585 [Panacagrimonas sp.]
MRYANSATIEACCLKSRKAYTAISAAWASPSCIAKARFGTKRLITEYVEAVADTLAYLDTADESEVPAAAKLDLFRRASHCYGRTVLMMSSGGMLMFFHFGAAKALFEPVQLMARDSSGNTVPFLTSRWIDGVFAADLPAKQLARLYGTNHYIVSYVNPVLFLTFRDPKTESAGFKQLVNMLRGTARNILKSTDSLIGRYVPASSVGVVNKVAHDLLPQDYVGDINVSPQRRLFSPHRLISPYTQREIGELMLEGERQAWPRLEMIRISSRISRTLDGILARAGAVQG